ncbi:apolipoprotein N-acyltransferase [Fundidesulfovibrio terrae]|uniref:apolipoprotein N-acyltransferase n=1 Tax=Fundidesulfovibrio terrae TaxID=2922866 RepID=UPI001FAE8DA9|nr:apolipoprotein N-acyltransferase [Fundidesulfovibrio terrae]
MTRPSVLDGPLRLVLLGTAAGFLAFANPVARLPLLVLGFPWVLAQLARQARDSRHALKLGWLTGAAAASASLYWIALPVHDYGFLPWILAVPCPLLMGAALGMYPAVFCWLLFATRESLRPMAWGALAGFSWIALEALRGWLFSGFPWLPLAAALVPWTPAIQAAALIGAYGLSGVLAACGVWLAGPGIASRAACAATLAALFTYGLWAVDQPVATSGECSAAMVQGNIDQAQKWEPDTLSRAIQQYADLSGPVLSPKPDVVIWPETALTFFVQEPGPESVQVKAFVKRAGVPLLAGAPGYERVGRNALVFNRAYLIAPSGQETFYEKEHLVPFGEYAPFGQDIPILSALLQGVGAFTPGTATAPLKAGRLAMGMLICYESIFPELAQKRVEAGANVLVNISNDAWFGRSAAPEQHLELARLRAVEQERFLLRATNTGYTALIDPKGRSSHQTQLFQEAAVAVTGVGLITETTVYHRLHGRLEAGAGLAALALLGFAAVKKRKTGA